MEFFQLALAQVHLPVGTLKYISDLAVAFLFENSHARSYNNLARALVFFGLMVKCREQLFTVAIVPALQNHGKFVAADAVYWTVFEEFAYQH